MHIPDPTTLGSVVRMRRLELGLSQTQLADTVGTTRQWLSRFEQATNDVSLSIMFAILDALDLTLDINGLGVAPATDLEANSEMSSDTSAGLQAADRAAETVMQNPESGTDRFALLRSRDALAGLRLPGARPPVTVNQSATVPVREVAPAPQVEPEVEPEVRRSNVPDPAVTAKLTHRLDQDIARIKKSSLFKR